MSEKRLLLLEDDVNFRKALAEDFIEKGYIVSEAGKLSQIQDRVFDFAVVDLRLLGESGLNAIKEIKKNNIECRIIILSGYGSVATAVEAIKLGALNYLHKPASCELIEAALLGGTIDESTNAFRVDTLDRHEHEYIEFVLSQNDGNITKTAKQLGLHRQSLQRKLKKHP
jgi:two-component system response regulator RegA